jgi:hypothetical protein
MCTNDIKTLTAQLAEAEDAKIDRKLLIEEYTGANEWERHWDLLRWNVSKFFLSIQTVFAIAALQGLLELGKTDIATNKPLIDKSLVASGLVILAIINIALCVIWWLRNAGIHAWHRASIERQKEIESDPRLRGTVAFFSSITRRMNGREGFLGKNGATGELECWGPPLAFFVLWVSISGLAVWFYFLGIIRDSHLFF